MNLIQRIFTWWNGDTIGTLLYTRRHGRKVGEDDQGNTFYVNEDGSKRWVMFNGDTEASRISPDWHGWLHHTYDAPPSEKPLPTKSWEKPHLPNMTGTTGAYVPPGAVTTPARRPHATGDYDAWAPE